MTPSHRRRPPRRGWRLGLVLLLSFWLTGVQGFFRLPPFKLPPFLNPSLWRISSTLSPSSTTSITPSEDQSQPQPELDTTLHPTRGPRLVEVEEASRSLLTEALQQHPYFQQTPHLGTSAESVIAVDHNGRRTPVTPDVFQTKAITTDAQFALLASGAGTGKSRVLAARIAYLVKQRGAEPSQILLLAFSKEAARSLRAHASALLGSLSPHPINSIDAAAEGEIYSGTFHGFALAILRAHGDPEQKEVTPMSRGQQMALLKRVISESVEWRQPLNQRDLGACLQHISLWKSSGAAPDDLDCSECVSSIESLACRAYPYYEARLRATGALDFDDVLIRATALLHSRPDVLQTYRSRFRHILVDEFQDVNKAQYTLLRTLALGADFQDTETGTSVLCAGDDDQSIYGFRGAWAAEIFMRFLRDFSGSVMMGLQVSYRLPSHILLAAQEMIQKNGPKPPLSTGPMPLLPRDPKIRNLLQQEEVGWDTLRHRIGQMVASRIVVQEVWDSKEEADFVARKVRELLASGTCKRLGEVAVLARSTWQLQEFERAFARHRIAVRSQGTGPKEQAVLPNIGNHRAFSFLRLLRVTSDDSAFKTVFNEALGYSSEADAVVSVVEGIAREQAKSIFLVAKEGLEAGTLPAGVSDLLEDFVHAVDYWSTKLASGYAKGRTGVQLLKEILTEAGCLGGPDDKAVEDLCFTVGNDYSYEDMVRFLESAGWGQGVGGWGDDVIGDAVVLSTMHGIKGQEFDFVFLTGWEEGIFPLGIRSQQPIGVSDSEWQAHLQEERRLGYVALTRARNNAYISFGHRRQMNGKWAPCSPSRFLRELPAELIKVQVMGINYRSVFKATNDIDFRRFLPQGSTRYDNLVLGALNTLARIPFSPDKRDHSSLLPSHITLEPDIATLSHPRHHEEEARVQMAHGEAPASDQPSLGEKEPSQLLEEVTGSSSSSSSSSMDQIIPTPPAIKAKRGGRKKTTKNATATAAAAGAGESSSASGEVAIKGTPTPQVSKEGHALGKLGDYSDWQSLIVLVGTLTPATKDLRNFYLEALKLYGFKRCRIWVMVSADGKMEERRMSACKAPHLGLFFLAQILQAPRPSRVKGADVKSLLRGLLSKYGVSRGRVDVPTEDGATQSRSLSSCSVAQLGSLLWGILVGELR